MNTLYKTLSLYLPKKQNKNLKLPCLYAYNGKNLINLYSYNSVYKIIEYNDNDISFDDRNKTEYIFVQTFINSGYKIVHSNTELYDIYAAMDDDIFPF